MTEEGNEVIAFVHILQKTRKCQMKASGLHSILHSGDDGNSLKSLKQVTALSVSMEVLKLD